MMNHCHKNLEKDVLPGVADMLHEVRIEGTFPDGTKLVTVHHPICRETGDAALALYGSGLSRAPAPGAAPANASPANTSCTRPKSSSTKAAPRWTWTS